MFDILVDVPLPKTLRTPTPGKRKYPYDKLQVGQMFCIPGRTKNNMSTYSSAAGKALNAKFVSRLIYMREVKPDVWAPCKEDETGASLGIGVWRVAPETTKVAKAA